EVGAQRALAIADHDQRFAGDGSEEVVAGAREPRGASDAVPAARENALGLLGEDRGRREVLAWKRVRALPERRRRGAETAHAPLLGRRRRACPARRGARTPLISPSSGARPPSSSAPRASR